MDRKKQMTTLIPSIVAQDIRKALILYGGVEALRSYGQASEKET